MNGKILWPKADRPVVLAPPIHRGVGRPPKIRRKDPTENKEEMEKKRQKKQNDNKKVMSRVGSRIKCGLCKQEGHNRSTCGRTSSYVYKYRGRGKNRVGATDVEELNLVDEFDGIDFEADLEGDNIAQTGNGGVGDTGNSGVGDTGNENEGDNAAGNEGTENNVNMDENEDTDLGPIWGRDGEGPSEMVVDIELWNELATQDELWNLQTQESTTIPDFAKGTGSAILPDSEAGDALNTVEKIAGKKTKSQILTTKLSAQTSVEKTCAKSAQTNSKVLATKERAIEPPPNANVTKAHATRTKKVQTSQQSEALSGPQSDTQHSSKQVVADKGKKTPMEVMAKRASLGLRNIVPKHPKAPAEHITLYDYEEHYDPQAKEMIVEPSTVQEQEQPEASHAGIHQAYTGPKRLGKGHILKKGKEYKTIATLLSEKKNEIAERKKKEAENKKEIVENKKKLAEKKKIEAEKKKRKN